MPTIQKEIYEKRLIRCPLCQSNRLSDHYSIASYEMPFKTSRCSACGFIFMNPRFTQATVRSFYTQDYYEGTTDYTYYDERSIFKYSTYVWNKRVAFIHKFIKKGNFLDIGASFGGLLQSAEKYFTPYGIELSPYSGKFAREKFGDKIHIGSLENHTFKHNFFSCITMIELIEHLADPVSALKECYRLLQNEGVLVIQTANMDGMQAKKLKDKYAYYMPGHLSYFTQQNLELILTHIGFSKIKTYYPVEFGLLPKLKKSRHTFKTLRDYKAWIRISLYHMTSKIHYKTFAATSSMVIYAFK